MICHMKKLCFEWRKFQMKHHLQRSGRQCNVHSSLMIPKILVDRPQQNKSNSELRKSVEILNVISYCEEVLWCHITERKQKTSDLPGWRPEHESTFKNIPSITDWNDGNNVSRHPICVSRELLHFAACKPKIVSAKRNQKHREQNKNWPLNLLPSCGEQ